MMGDIGSRFAQVTIESDWWSKINWTQVVGVICSSIAVLTAGKFDVSPATQVNIVLTIQAVTGILTVWLRRHSTTITPTAAANLEK